jgi:hypothetical protein
LDDFARIAGMTSSEPPIDCQRPFSNFHFIDSRFGGCWPLRRILSQVRLLNGKTLILEILNKSKDISEEDEDIKQLCANFDPSKIKTYRISFFSSVVKSIKEIESISDKNFLGYAILRNYIIPATPGILDEKKDEFRIYESVMKQSRHDNNYVRQTPTWQCRVDDKLFKISGHLYAQQNGLSNSCSHVALRAAAGIFQKSDISYRDINRVVADYRTRNSLPQKTPNKGLTNKEISAVLESLGAKCFVGDFTGEAQNKPEVHYQKYLYGAIESGFPAIVFFGFEPEDSATHKSELKYHVIPMFGHTFNEDTWVPDANIMYFPFRTKTKTLSSDNWLSMFIGHDDNAGSNYCTPQHYLEPMRLCPKKNYKERCPSQKGFVAYAIGTIPAKIEVDPIEAELVAADLLPPVLESAPKKYCPWQSRLEIYLKHKLLVLRPLLISGAEYQKHLRKIRGWDNSKIPENMIESFGVFDNDDLWMVELSVPELFSANKRKIGEILISTNKKLDPTRNFESFCFARIPGCFAFLDKIDSSGKPIFNYFQVGVQDHVEIFGSEES